MTELRLELHRDNTSTIVVERGCRQRLGELLTRFASPPRKVALVSDRNVAPLHGESVEASLTEAGFEVKDFLVPPGEESKSYKMLENLWDRMLAFGMERRDLVLALGGGVVGDLAGFAAATLKRGVDFVQVPTTLLAQVDAAIGGKTGVNASSGKNLVGAFHQPLLTVVDAELLESLPEQELRAGLAEVVKYGFIRDPTILNLLERQISVSGLLADHSALDEILDRSIRIKTDIVQRDETEQGERAFLNFGHTVGHALEAVTGYRELLHGEAVAIGMVAAAFLAVDLGKAPPELPARIAGILERFDLPVATHVPPGTLLPVLQRDKKRHKGRVRWVLVREPGSCELAEEVDPGSVLRSLDAIHRPGDDRPTGAEEGADG